MSRDRSPALQANDSTMGRSLEPFPPFIDITSPSENHPSDTASMPNRHHPKVLDTIPTRYITEFIHMSEPAICTIIRKAQSMDPSAPILIHASEAKHFLVATYNYLRKKYGYDHIAFQWNDKLSPMYSEVRRYIINTHSQESGPLRLVSPGMLWAEVGTCLKVALSEYVRECRELKDGVEHMDEQDRSDLESDLRQRFQVDQRQLEPSCLAAYAVQKGPVVAEVGMIWQECIWIWLDMCHWRHFSRLEENGLAVKNETACQGSKRRFLGFLKCW